MPRKSQYSVLWEDATRFPKYAKWVSACNDVHAARCKLCAVTFSIANMGVAAVESHMKGAKHQSAQKALSAPDIRSVFSIQRSSENQISSPPASSTLSVATSSELSTSPPTISPSSSRTVLSSPIHPNQKRIDQQFSLYQTDAEILWCLRLIMQHDSFNSCTDLCATFSTMFPDSDIAKSMTLGRDKAAYIITYGLAPLFKTQLLNQLSKPTPVLFTTSFDEAYNKVVFKNQSDAHVTFFDTNINRVSTRYIGSSFLGHTRSSDILNGLLDVHKPLDVPQYLAQLSMDGPNVNWAVLREVANLKSDNSCMCPELLELGSCGLHIMHGAFKTGQNATSWNVHQLLRSAYYLFKQSPARRSDYLLSNEIEDDDCHALFPLPFCGHRWLENGPTITRLISLLPKIQIYIKYVESQPVSKRPTSDSYKTLKTNLLPQSSVDYCYCVLEFSLTMCRLLEPFLTRFQAERPLAPFLYQELFDIIKGILSTFVSDDIIREIANGSSLCSVDLDKKENLKPSDKFEIGFGAKAKMKKMSPANILSFRSDAKHMLVATCKKLLEKCPLKYKLTKAISALSPFVITKSASIAQSRMTNLLTILHEKKYLTSGVADSAKRQFSTLVSDRDFIDKCKSFNIDTDRLDDFYYTMVGSKSEYVEIWSVIKIVLILSHGNARVEAGFSINKDVLCPNLKSQTIQAQRIVYDAIKNAGGPLKVSIDQDMRNSVKLARQRYRCALEEKKTRDNEISKRRSHKRDISSQIRELEEERQKRLKVANTEANDLTIKIASLKNLL